MDSNEDKNPLETLKNIENGLDPNNIPVSYPYQARPDAELKKIAADIYNGKIFTDRFVNSPSDTLMIFMPLLFLQGDAHKDFFDDLGMIFEYYSEAGPRGINGYPIFMSARKLSKSDSDRMIVFYDEYKAMQDKIKTGWGEEDLSNLNNIPINAEDYDASDNY